MKPTPRQYQEAVERTKKIKEHLIKEGYAENEESAESIISDIKASLSYTYYTISGVSINVELYNAIKG